MAEEAEEATVERTRGRVLPLNSRRLTSEIVSRIAKALELPDSGTLEDTRQMVEGKLIARGREPKNVQVVVHVAEGGVDPVIELRDADGVFETIEPDPEVEAEAETGEATENGERTAVTEESYSENGDGVMEARVTELEQELASVKDDNAGLLLEVGSLSERIVREKDKYKELWRHNCEQLAEYDAVLADKEEEIETLKRRIAALEAVSRPPGTLSSPSLSRHVARTEHPIVSPARPSSSRRGKAPPVDPFDGETADVTFEDWLPTLTRAASWNGWSDEETLMQLAGHLRKRALIEWNLLSSEDKTTLAVATEALRVKLDPGCRTLAAQEFRHSIQRETEPVADYIRRLEQAYRKAYGRDGMSSETRDTLLHGQLQEGLQYELMKSPAVSGAQGYQELCLAAKNEERRLAELGKRRQYMKP